MTEYFTQRSVNAVHSEPRDPPPQMLRRFSFIVTGLKASAEGAASADFIKLQIKSLGGRLVNFRVANRRPSGAIARLKKRRLDEGDDNAYEEDLPQCILISDKPQRTLKYVTALVNGVPCVHYRWFLA